MGNHGFSTSKRLPQVISKYFFKSFLCIQCGSRWVSQDSPVTRWSISDVSPAPFFLGPWPGQAIFQAESPIFFWGPAIELGWWKMSSFLKIFWVQPGDMISQISHDHPPAIEDCIRRWLTRRHTCPTCRPTYGGYMVATKKMWEKPNTRLSPGEILVSITIGSWSKPPLECFFRRGTHGGQVFAEVWGEFSMFLLHEWSSMAINARILSAMNKYGHPLYVLPEFCFAGICS